MVLTKQHQMIRDALREFSQQQLVQHAVRLDDVLRTASLNNYSHHLHVMTAAWADRMRSKFPTRSRRKPGSSGFRCTQAASIFN